MASVKVRCASGRGVHRQGTATGREVVGGGGRGGDGRVGWRGGGGRWEVEGGRGRYWQVDIGLLECGCSPVCTANPLHLGGRSVAAKRAKMIEMFFAYSHKDEELRDVLEKHLSILKRQGVITAWHDRKIGAGREWEGQIDEHLNTARVILLLISADFLASDYCYDVEVKRAMERHEAREARVIPVVLRAVDWKGAPFRKLQALPKDARPVTSWPNRDEAFADVAKGIRAAVEELVAKPPASGTASGRAQAAAEAVAEAARPNVVFDGFEYVRDQLVRPANIGEDSLSEFACLWFVNEPDIKGPTATVPDLHARIEISQSGNRILAVADGRWAENVDREQAAGRETKSVPLPGNGETRTLNVVMQRRGEDECYGWSHGGRKIPQPPIPKGSYEVRVELAGSNMETRTFLFELRNNGREDFLELREAAGFTNPCSAKWTNERSAVAIECRTESGIRLDDERMALAYLVVRSVNQGQIQNAYVKVHRILEHTFQSINKEWRPYTQRLYEHEDIFLKWQATEERYHSFHSEAVLNVARGRRGDGRYGLISHVPNLFPRLQIWDWYEITLHIAADNSPLLQRTLILKMEEPIVEMDGKRVSRVTHAAHAYAVEE